MASLTVWTDFQKRKNSTKQPTGGTVVDVKLKDNTSIENPVFICNNLANANYCKYNDNYYFVDDVVFVTNTIAEIHCSMDALATNKSSIVGAPAFVKYYTHNNTEISDPRLSTKTEATYSMNSGTWNHLGSSNGNDCVYMLTVSGFDSTCVYAVTQNTLKGLINQTMIGEIVEDLATAFGDLEHLTLDWAGLVTAIIGYCKAQMSLANSALYSGNAAENIRNCFSLPISASEFVTTGTKIYLGNYDTKEQGGYQVNRIYHDNCTVTIPWQADDWRRNAPYHEIYLYLPFIGLTQLSTSDLIGETILNIECSMDLFSGDTVFTVRTNISNRVVGQYNTNLAVNYQIGGTSNQLSRATMIVGSTALSVGTAAASLGVGAAVSGAMSESAVVGASSSAMGATSGGALGLVNAMNPTPYSIGSNTGGACLGLTDKNAVKCYSVFHDTTVTPSSVSALIGTPYNGVMAIPSSGFVQTVHADIQSNAFGNEKSQINAMLDSGIYIE